MITTLARVTFIIGSGIALRLALVELLHHYQTDLSFLDLGFLALTLLPTLEIITLVSLLPSTCWILSSPRLETTEQRYFQLPLLLMPGLLVNAAWRILEYVLSIDSCQSTSGGELEAFCDVVETQIFTNVPFLFLGTLALIYHLSKKES